MHERVLSISCSAVINNGCMRLWLSIPVTPQTRFNKISDIGNSSDLTCGRLNYATLSGNSLPSLYADLSN